MKLSILTSLIICLSIISGCTVSRIVDPKWQKVGISQHDTRSAVQKCKYQIGIAKVNSEKENSLFSSCMESEGYRYTSQRLAER